jgi:hypothetical protein
MKTSLSKLKSSLILLAGITCFSVEAKPVAQVTQLNGAVFVISSEGKTTKLRVNDHLEDKSEVLVEEGANITLNDYYDATYHLIGGTHLKFFDKSVQLKKGKTWIQSLNSRHPLALTTANGYVDYWKGEFIATFDQVTSRSQILVVHGEVDVSNVLDRNMKYSVSAGTFTMLDPEVENGLPRTPTRVGLNSLNEALVEFKRLPESMQKNTPNRAIASVNEEKTEHIKKGKILFINADGKKVSRLPASVSGQAHDYFKVKSKRRKPKKGLSSAPIRFYGFSQSGTALRTPASVKTQVPEVRVKKAPSALSIDHAFSSSLKEQELSQPKYPKELNNLINDLKSY